MSFINAALKYGSGHVSTLNDTFEYYSILLL